MVFSNLISNARDALVSTRTEHPRINVKLTPVAPTATGPAEAARDSVRVTISDNGPGMPEYVQRRVFDPFFTTKGPSAGTGLGLAISWSVIRSAGGNIECDSSPGRGSAFHVFLPVCGQKARERDSKPPRAQRTEPLSILLVDDDLFVRRVTRRALLRARHSVMEAATAKEALSVAVQGRYDVVLLDQWLPDSCGTDIIDELRRLTKGAKIVLFTAQDVDASITRSADALLSKPMGARELLDTLASLMA
jgi:CheY-like chemotaxis protein